jgi:hypothetical protein
VRALSALLAALLLSPPAAPIDPRVTAATPCPTWCTADGEPRVVRLTLRNLSQVRDREVLEVAQRIWKPYGIQLEPNGGAGAISVVLVPGRKLAPEDHSVPVLGTTLFARRHALPFITLSQAAAEALVADSEIGVIPFRSLSSGQQSEILARMLGVALAHELGHYLLDTMDHSSEGLLQPSLRARELAFPELRRLTLTPAQQRQLCHC